METTFEVESFSTFTITWNVLAEIPETEVPMGGYLCGLEEHTHVEACYDAETGELICGMEEHTHDESCLPEEDGEYICGLEEHTHTEACYDENGELICTIPEHVHDESCLPPAELPMTFPEELPEGYAAYSFDNEDGLSVLAYAPEDAFEDKKVTLFAEVLAEDSDEYVQAEKNLTEAEDVPEYSGMVAMDIRFVDAAAEDPAEAEEIEPAAEAGPVYVKIDAKALIPEDVDESTLAVQHHAETTDDGLFGTGIFANTEVKVETVADASAGTGDVTVLPGETVIPEAETALADEPEAEPAALSAESDAEAAPAVLNDVEASFGVESFSKFTITWNNNSLTVYYVNEQGEEIRGTQTLPVEANKDEWISLADYAGEISGYEYQNARVGNLNGNVATYIRYATVSTGWWGGSQSGWFYNTTTNGNGRQFTGAIYLVYRQISTGEPIDYTVDTASKGIHINLFDYNGTTNLDYNNGYINEGVNDGHTLKFSGGQGTAGSFNKWTGNRSPFSGIVSSSLGTDGYPYLNSTTTGASDSLGYLFGAGGNDSVTAHTNLNKLFIQDVEGYYVYNAAQNFATLTESTDYTNSTTATNGLDFTVYDIQSQVVNTGSAEQNVLFLPFNNLNDNVGSVNYHFGMTIDFKFIMPEDGQINGKDMVFEFEGDDDVWVFIDGKLALDLGGIHDAASGSINFNTGVITVNGVAQSQTLWELLGVEKFSNYSEHSFNFYYLERGKGASNCKIVFNMPTVPTGSISVSKDLNATSDYQQEHSSDTYRMQLFVDGQAKADTEYVDLDGDYLGTTDENGYFDLADGQTAIFNTIPVYTRNYYVKELGVVKVDDSFTDLQDANFNNVSFNGVSATVSSDGATSYTYTFNSSSTNNVVVKNTPTEGGEDQSFLRIEKSFSLPGLDMAEEAFEALVKDSSYTINLYNGTDETGTPLRRLEAKNAAVSWNNTTDTGTLVWNVYTSASGNFYMTEENYESLFQLVGYTWTARDGFNEVIQVDPPSIQISNNDRVSTCKANFYNVGDINFVVAALTSGDGYLVYTDVPISQGERQSIVEWAKTQQGPFRNITMSNSAFYSHQTNPDGFTFRGSVIQHPCDADSVRQMMQENGDLTVYDEDNRNQVTDDGIYLYFSLPSQWAQFVYGTYTVEGGNADLSTSNTYVPSTGDLSITKTVWRTDTDSASYEGEFTFDVTVPGASGEYTATYKTANTAVGAQRHEDGKVNFDGTTSKATVVLYAGETVKIEGLPSNVQATIVETNYSGYAPEWSDTESVTDENPTDIASTAAGTVTTKEISASNEIKVTCTNTTGAVLPSTGGTGVGLYLAFGSLLTLGAGLLLIQRRRKEGSDAV